MDSKISFQTEELLEFVCEAGHEREVLKKELAESKSYLSTILVEREDAEVEKMKLDVNMNFLSSEIAGVESQIQEIKNSVLDLYKSCEKFKWDRNDLTKAQSDLEKSLYNIGEHINIKAAGVISKIQKGSQEIENDSTDEWATLEKQIGELKKELGIDIIDLKPMTNENLDEISNDLQFDLEKKASDLLQIKEERIHYEEERNNINSLIEEANSTNTQLEKECEEVQEANNSWKLEIEEQNQVLSKMINEEFEENYLQNSIENELKTLKNYYLNIEKQNEREKVNYEDNMNFISLQIEKLQNDSKNVEEIINKNSVCLENLREDSSSSPEEIQKQNDFKGSEIDQIEKEIENIVNGQTELNKQIEDIEKHVNDAKLVLETELKDCQLIKDKNDEGLAGRMKEIGDLESKFYEEKRKMTEELSKSTDELEKARDEIRFLLGEVEKKKIELEKLVNDIAEEEKKKKISSAEHREKWNLLTEFKRKKIKASKKQKNWEDSDSSLA